MRKLFSFLFICLVVSANARQITADEAASIASEFLNSSATVQKSGKRANVRRAPAKDASAGNEDNQPYYVFNASDDKGFVIISGDDRAKKILGYSDTGNLDMSNMPPQLAAMLDQYSEQISKLEGDATDSSWSAPLKVASTNEGVLLETANWGQGYPYNAQCPIIDGVQCPTGCVATAMAIVMKYHNWPERGEYSNVYWDPLSWDYTEYDFKNLNLEWNNILNEYDKESSIEAIQAVASLMTATGHSVQMNYSQSESGALACYAGHALRTHFKYAESCEFIDASKYTFEDWVTMLKTELDESRPVLYQGSGIGNHEFVCDGYSSDDLFHINWGWDGYANGYYALTALNPHMYNFSMQSSMVRGIKPDKENIKFSDAYVDAGYVSTANLNSIGANMDVENIVKNEPFNFTCSVLTTPAGFSGEYGVGIVDKNGKVKTVLSRYNIIGRRDSRVETCINALNLVSEIEPESTDRIQIITKKISENEWLAVRGTSEAPSFLPAKGNSVKLAEIELCSESEKAIFQKHPGIPGGNIDLNKGIITLPIGTKISCYFPYNNILDLDDAKLTCIIEHNENLEAIPLIGPNVFAHEFVIKKGKYKITLVEDLCKPLKISNDYAGKLKDKTTPYEAATVSELYIEGPIDISDINYIKKVFVNINKLDLSKASLLSCEINGDIYEANALPSYSLSGLKDLESVYLPNDLQIIGDYAFADCNLHAIDIPSSVKKLGSGIFSNNPNMNAVMVHWENPLLIDDDVFYMTVCPRNGILYIPENTYELYSTSAIWSVFSSIIEKQGIDINPIKIENNGIKYMLSLIDKKSKIIGYNKQISSNVILKDKIIYGDSEFTIESIQAKSFSDCKIIEHFEMPNTINEIGENAFFSCENLKTVKLSNNISTIPTSCFCYCYALEEADIPESVKFIDWGAFDTNKSLKRIHLPAETYLSPNGAFDGISSCSSITVDENNPYYLAKDNMLYSKDKKSLILIAGAKEGKLKIPDYVENLPWRLCSHMPNITGIEFPNNYSNDIPYQLIWHCPRLRHISLPDKSKKTNSETIAECDSLESITIGRNLEYGTGIHNNPILKDVYLRNIANLDLGQLFNDWQGSNEVLRHKMNFYTDQINPNVILDKCMSFNVPGACSNLFEGIAECNVAEMWEYKIDRSNNQILLNPAIENLVIDKVTINGKETISEDGYIYKFSGNENLDVVVDFTLHNRQSMTTHYDAEFNASMPNTDLSKVTGIALNKTEHDLYVGETLSIVATISPNYALNKNIVWTSSNDEVAKVNEDGNVIAVSVGEAVITASTTDGSGVFANCVVEVYLPSLGDSNANGEVTITDAVNTANFAIGNETPRFCFAAADVNTDGIITLADATGTVTLILDQPYAISMPAKVSAVDQDEISDFLVFDDYRAMAGESATVAVSLVSNIDYTALQADIRVPEGMMLEAVNIGERAIATHSLATRRIDDRSVRVVLFNLGNKTFAQNDMAILELTVKANAVADETITATHIMASDDKAREYTLASKGGVNMTVSSIDTLDSHNVRIVISQNGIEILNAKDYEVTVLSLDGVVITNANMTSTSERITLDKGVYIVKVSDRTFKVML